MKFGSYASNQIYAYAKLYGVKATPISYKDNLILLEHNKKTELVKQTATRFTNIIQGRICDNKFLAVKYLKDNGIANVPDNIVIKNIEDINTHKIQYPVVVKPLKGHGGKGISIGIRTKRELENAFRIAKKVYYRVLIEQYVEGEDYRFLVIDKDIFVAKRIPAHILGDGKSTIQALLEKENKKRTRKDSILVPIRINKEVTRILQTQKYTLTSIPKKNTIVYLRKNANLSTGGSTIDYTNITHADNKDLALKIAKIMNMKIIAIDFLFKDPTKPHSKDNGIVIEINDTPGIRLHHPREKEIVYAICKLLFPTLS